MSHLSFSQFYEKTNYTPKLCIIRGGLGKLKAGARMVQEERRNERSVCLHHLAGDRRRGLLVRQLSDRLARVQVVGVRLQTTVDEPPTAVDPARLVTLHDGHSLVLQAPVPPPHVCLPEQKLRLVIDAARIAGGLLATPLLGVDPESLGLPLGVFLLVAASEAPHLPGSALLLVLGKDLLRVLREAQILAAPSATIGLKPIVLLWSGAIG